MLRRPGFLPLRELLVGRTQVTLQKYLAGVRPPEKITNRIMFLRQDSEKPGNVVLERLKVATD